MQNERTCRSVLGIGILLLVHFQASSATTIEDLLSAQNTHEDAAHADFVSWCKGAQKKLSDRVSFQKERIDELTGAIESYSETVGQLRHTAKPGSQPLAVLSQEQRVQLIQKESEHWRSVHAKDAAKRLLKADTELLEAVESALQWEDSALTQHQSVRQHLIALVREHHLDKPIDVAQQPPSQPAAAITTPVAEVAAESLLPPASLRKAAPAALPPQALRNMVAPVKTVKSLVEAVSAPMFGISKLPALELVQADAVPQRPIQMPTGVFSALQGATHPSALSSTAAAAAAATAATEQLFTPMVAAATAPVHAAAPKPQALNALQLLAGMSVGGPAKVVPVVHSSIPSATSAMAGLTAEMKAVPAAPEVAAVPAADPAPVVATAAPVAVPVVVPAVEVAPATPPAAAEVPAIPSATSAMAGLTAAMKAAPAVPAAPEVAAVPAAQSAPVVATAAPVAPPAALPDPPAAEAPTLPALKAVQPHKAVATPPAAQATNLASMVEAALPVLTPEAAQPAAKATKASLVQTVKQASKKKKADDADDEDALMAAMMGAVPEVPEAPTPPKPKPTKAVAFLATKSAPKPAEVVTIPPASEENEDALMDIMMKDGDVPKPDPVSAPEPPAPKPASSPKSAPVQPKPASHAPKVLTQTAHATQKVHASSANLQAHVVAKTQEAVVEKKADKPAADPQAGVMQSFIQEVTDLGQGEPGNDIDPAAPVKAQEEEKTQESDADVMSSFVQQVSRLSQGESDEEAKPTPAPVTETGLALSGDLASLMGLGGGSEPASFLQVSSHGRRTREMSRSELAAASLIEDLEDSEVAKRLAKTVSQSTAGANVQMLTALKEQLEARPFQWTCAKGPAAAHSMEILQLAETGTSLLKAERDTVSSLTAELRDSQAASAQMKSEFVALLEQTLGRAYDADSTDLESLPLAQISSETQIGASAISALENVLRSDAVAARQLGAKWVNQGSEFVRLGDELFKESSAKDSELKKASKVLADARARAASSRRQVAKETGCSDAVHTSGLIAAVYKALHILAD